MLRRVLGVRIMQSAGASFIRLHRGLYLLKRPELDLADALPGYSMFSPKFFQFQRLVPQPAGCEDATFTRVKRCDGFFEGLVALRGLDVRASASRRQFLPQL